jgi:chromosome segregation ATPase
MDLLSIIQSVVSSGILIAMIEYFRYRKKDRQEVGSIEEDNIKKTLENSILSSETNKKLMESMRTKIEFLINDFNMEREDYRKQLREAKEEIDRLKTKVDDFNTEREDYRKQLREAKEEIDRLKKMVDDLIMENKKLQEELHLTIEQHGKRK